MTTTEMSEHMIETVHYVNVPRPETALCGADVTGVGVWTRQVAFAGKPLDETHELCLDCDVVFQQG